MAEWFSVRHELEQGALVGVEPPQARLDDLDEPRRRCDLADQPPDPVAGTQAPVVEGTLHELADEHGVALAPLGEQCGGGRVDRSAQHGDEQGGGGVGVEAGHLDALGQPVLPQGDHGVGSRVTGPHGREHGGRARHGDLVHERGGRIVEQVGVVDEQQQPAVLRPGRQGGDGAVQQIGAVAHGGPAGSRHVQQRGDGAEGQLGR